MAENASEHPMQRSAADEEPRRLRSRPSSARESAPGRTLPCTELHV